ncbi:MULTISPECIES: hypothetical protein [unclassified Cyanobium]|uniref:hypothetical protein n=1 Tax=unclassified Cyanobium TaxID=2627006 RepID=UPI0020CBE8E0|nr:MULTISPECIES: hypothetical protein [unclassified Cyanobium]MCP9777703.1 hypothetical protein [Cyanobium sp. Tous-M-B4]MCP9875395.1 hypothetical protein [Cyanobium sp. A2C-AMD]
MATVFNLETRNSGLLLGTGGDDLVQGSASTPELVNGRNGVIRLQKGSDTIRFGSFRNPGVVQLGRGQDLITGLDTLRSGRVSREGDGQGGIWMGQGADLLGSASERLNIDSVGLLDLGAGNDQVYATDLTMGWAPIVMGAGDDLLDVAGEIVIRFASGILGDAGDDRIIAGSGLVLDPDAGINLGAGNDLIDASAGFQGLWGSGNVRLGPGDDVFRGFLAPRSDFPDSVVSPWGTLQGGKGKDVHVLPPGTYEVVKEKSDFYPSLFSLRDVQSELEMGVSGINALAGLNGGRAAIAEGLFEVSADGIGAFA